MFFIGLFIIAITTTISNMKVNTKDSEIKDKKHGFILMGTLAIFFIFDLITFKLGININIIIYCIMSVGFMVLNAVILNSKQKNIIEKHKVLREAINCLSPIRKGKDVTNIEEIESEVKFEYNSNGKVEKITCPIDEKDKNGDAALTKVVLNLNKFLNYRKWKSSVDLDNLECYFISEEHPPTMARYPGSFLRPDGFIPLGVTNKAEILWNLGSSSKSDASDSLFFYENGEKAGTYILPKAPQSLVAGSTGGGKAIWIHQEIF